MTRSFVASLSFMGSPAAIPGFVVSIDIDAVKRHVLGSLSHVFKKCSKRQHPSLTHGDSSSAIVREVDGRRIRATPNHVGPTVVFASEFVCESVLNETQGRAFGSEATTTLRCTRTKMGPQDDGGFPAVAFAAPRGASMQIIPGKFKDEESAETLVDEVNLGGHRVPQLLGVMARDVGASPCLYFTRKAGIKVAAMPRQFQKTEGQTKW